ncbi:MAG: Sialic acid TRAP transporter permease protein SiaT [Firmicutes bacterium]|nr:Sialic acid TRAP transporter permease protein SiaT [candidate division NPL-UPA2 bacterium]
MKETLFKAYTFVGEVEMWLAKAGVLLFTALIFLSAVSRTAGRPWGWTQDWAIFVFVWCVFFSADVCLRQDKLVTVDIVTIHLSPKINAYLKAFNLLLIVAFLAFLVYYGISLTYTSRFVRFQGLPHFSYSWVAVSLPVGALLMLITSGVKFFAHLKTMSKPEKVGAK